MQQVKTLPMEYFDTEDIPINGVNQIRHGNTLWYEFRGSCSTNTTSIFDLMLNYHDNHYNSIRCTVTE